MRPPSWSRRRTSPVAGVVGGSGGCGGWRSGARGGVCLLEWSMKGRRTRSRWRRLRISSQSRHSARTVRTNRSASRSLVGLAPAFSRSGFLRCGTPHRNAAVFAVAIADQEPPAPLAEVEAEVARLLGHPLASRIPRATREPDATARVRDKEEHVEAAEQDGLDGEEIPGDDAG